MRSVPQRSPSSATTAEATSTFVRMPNVLRMTGLCRSTIYRLIAEDKFPTPVKLGDRAVAWRQSDLDRWSSAREPSSH